MLRKITPFLILAILIFIFSIYILIKEREGWGIFFVFTFFIIAIIIFFIDLGLSKWINDYRLLLLIESIIIAIIIFTYTYKHRTKTLILPSNFDKEYVTLIYGVDNNIDLSISALTWSKQIKIPENGILLTSSKANMNLPDTKIKLKSGIYLNSYQTKIRFKKMVESSFKSNGQVYKFRTWKIKEGFCCTFSKEEIKKYTTELKYQFEINKDNVLK